MSIFNRKLKVPLRDLCYDFYDKNIFNPDISNVDAAEVFAEVNKKLICDVCPSFYKIDTKTFVKEISLLRTEIFCLAFLHIFGDENTVAQTQITRDYLIEKRKEDYWNDLELYNQAIASSSKLNLNLETGKGRAYIAFTNRMRMGLYDAWVKKGFDGKCAARAANRIATDVACKQNMTQNYLMMAMCNRLGYEYKNDSKLCNKYKDELNDESQFRIVAMIKGFYNGSISALKNMKVI